MTFVFQISILKSGSKPEDPLPNTFLDINFKNDFRMKILDIKYLLQTVKGGIESQPKDPPPRDPPNNYTNNTNNNK